MIRVLVVAGTSSERLKLRAQLEEARLTVVGGGPGSDRSAGFTDGVDVVVFGNEALLGGAGTLVDGREEGMPAFVVLAQSESAVETLRGLPLRGWGIVPPEPTTDELSAAVRAAASGLVVLPGALSSRVLSARRPAGDLDPDGYREPLTPRERQVLDFVARGLSNRVIAERLGISEHTVKFHVSSIYGKLGVSGRAEAVSQGLRQGLISV
jgi:DNA-binding NarL/FixJ family response regulator